MKSKQPFERMRKIFRTFTNSDSDEFFGVAHAAIPGGQFAFFTLTTLLLPYGGSVLGPHSIELQIIHKETKWRHAYHYIATVFIHAPRAQ